MRCDGWKVIIVDAIMQDNDNGSQIRNSDTAYYRNRIDSDSVE